MKEEDLQMKWRGLIFFNRILMAGGVCRTLEEVREWVESAVAAILIGSITLKKREGNKGQVYWEDEKRKDSLNTNGLPNLAVEYYEAVLPQMLEMAHNTEQPKPLIVSIVGFTPEEWVRLAMMFLKWGADALELNFSCPNVWLEKEQEIIPCFHPYLVEEILDKIQQAVGQEARIIVKVSPFSDPFGLRTMADCLSKFPLVKALTVCNTFANSFAFDENGNPAITFGDGLAGLGGSSLKYITLGQIMQFKKWLRQDIAIFGCGGISSGEDVGHILDAGADFAQVGTYFMKDGVNRFDKLLLDFVMKR